MANNKPNSQKVEQGKTTPAVAEKVVEQKEKVLQVPGLDKNISDNIFKRVSALEQSGGLNFPANYSYANAIKSAWLKIQATEDKNKKPALTVCTKESIANALLDMVIQGLSPMKNQCYFIVFGNTLTLMRSYFGTIAVTKRLAAVTDAFANVIYEGDNFQYAILPESGDKKIIQHEQHFSNINPGKIIGAYAVILRKDSTPYVEIMTIDQIRKAWNQGAATGSSPAHKNFPEEMAKKSVLNRGCKIFFNTSDDSDLLIEAVNRTTANEYLPENDYEETVQHQIEENANKIELDVNAQIENDSDSASIVNEDIEESRYPTPTATEVVWDQPLSVLTAYQALKTTKELSVFKTKNMARLQMLEGDKSLMKAMAIHEDKVLKQENEKGF